MLRRVHSSCSATIQLLNGYEPLHSFLLVLEHPEPPQDLFDFIKKQRFLPEDLACGVFFQVLVAVWHCHSCGILHRDIKSKNIILNLATGEVELLDFVAAPSSGTRVYTKFSSEPTAKGAPSTLVWGF